MDFDVAQVNLILNVISHHVELVMAKEDAQVLAELNKVLNKLLKKLPF